MKKIILVLGGARSGKSHYAVELAKKLGNPSSLTGSHMGRDSVATSRTVFLATMECLDEEMQERIKLHRQHRPAEWQTVEEGKDVDKVILNLKGLCDVVIIDCLTNLVSNLLLELQEINKVKVRIEEIIQVIGQLDATVLIVSNEVGCGVVPETPLGRKFRDIAGIANQLVAKYADEVYLLTAGIPICIKKSNESVES
jgi:adenosylcobinamide kinase/adenosylcobinamide-phosphate guanylyltransferase